VPALIPQGISKSFHAESIANAPGERKKEEGERRKGGRRKEEGERRKEENAELSTCNSQLTKNRRATRP
jgi:hypothetical protein